jgi:hypothetical protein
LVYCQKFDANSYWRFRYVKRLSVARLIFRPPKRLVLSADDDDDDGDNDDDNENENAEPKRKRLHPKTCAKQHCDHPPPPDPPRFPFTPLPITSVQPTSVSCPASSEGPLTGNEFGPESTEDTSMPVVVTKIHQLASNSDPQLHEENVHPSNSAADAAREVTANGVGPSCIHGGRMMTPIDVQFSVDQITEGNAEHLVTPRSVARLHVQDSSRTVPYSVSTHHQSITCGGGRLVSAYRTNSFNAAKSMSEPRSCASGNSRVTAPEAVGKTP